MKELPSFNIKNDIKINEIIDENINENQILSTKKKENDEKKVGKANKLLNRNLNLNFFRKIIENDGVEKKKKQTKNQYGFWNDFIKNIQNMSFGIPGVEAKTKINDTSSDILRGYLEENEINFILGYEEYFNELIFKKNKISDYLKSKIGFNNKVISYNFYKMLDLKTDEKNPNSTFFLYEFTKHNSHNYGRKFTQTSIGDNFYIKFVNIFKEFKSFLDEDNIKNSFDSKTYTNVMKYVIENMEKIFGDDEYFQNMYDFLNVNTNENYKKFILSFTAINVYHLLVNVYKNNSNEIMEIKNTYNEIIVKNNIDNYPDIDHIIQNYLILKKMDIDNYLLYVRKLNDKIKLSKELKRVKIELDKIVNNTNSIKNEIFNNLKENYINKLKEAKYLFSDLLQNTKVNVKYFFEDALVKKFVKEREKKINPSFIDIVDEYGKNTVDDDPFFNIKNLYEIGSTILKHIDNPSLKLEKEVDDIYVKTYEEIKNYYEEHEILFNHTNNPFIAELNTVKASVKTLIIFKKYNDIDKYIDDFASNYTNVFDLKTKDKYYNIFENLYDQLFDYLKNEDFIYIKRISKESSFMDKSVNLYMEIKSKLEKKLNKYISEKKDKEIIKNLQEKIHLVDKYVSSLNFFLNEITTNKNSATEKLKNDFLVLQKLTDSSPFYEGKNIESVIHSKTFFLNSFLSQMRHIKNEEEKKKKEIKDKKHSKILSSFAQYAAHSNADDNDNLGYYYKTNEAREIENVLRKLGRAKYVVKETNTGDEVKDKIGDFNEENKGEIIGYGEFKQKEDKDLLEILEEVELDNEDNKKTDVVNEAIEAISNSTSNFYKQINFLKSKRLTIENHEKNDKKIKVTLKNIISQEEFNSKLRATTLLYKFIDNITDDNIYKFSSYMISSKYGEIMSKLFSYLIGELSIDKKVNLDDIYKFISDNPLAFKNYCISNENKIKDRYNDLVNHISMNILLCIDENNDEEKEKNKEYLFEKMKSNEFNKNCKQLKELILVAESLSQRQIKPDFCKDFLNNVKNGEFDKVKTNINDFDIIFDESTPGFENKAKQSIINLTNRKMKNKYGNIFGKGPLKFSKFTFFQNKTIEELRNHTMFDLKNNESITIDDEDLIISSKNKRSFFDYTTEVFAEKEEEEKNLFDEIRKEEEEAKKEEEENKMVIDDEVKKNIEEDLEITDEKYEEDDDSNNKENKYPIGNPLLLNTELGVIKSKKDLILVNLFSEKIENLSKEDLKLLEIILSYFDKLEEDDNNINDNFRIGIKSKLQEDIFKTANIKRDLEFYQNNLKNLISLHNSDDFIKYLVGYMRRDNESFSILSDRIGLKTLYANSIIDKLVVIGEAFINFNFDFSKLFEMKYIVEKTLVNRVLKNLQVKLMANLNAENVIRIIDNQKKIREINLISKNNKTELEEIQVKEALTSINYANELIYTKFVNTTDPYFKYSLQKNNTNMTVKDLIDNRVNEIYKEIDKLNTTNIQEIVKKVEEIIIDDINKMEELKKKEKPDDLNYFSAGIYNSIEIEKEFKYFDNYFKDVINKYYIVEIKSNFITLIDHTKSIENYNIKKDLFDIFNVVAANAFAEFKYNDEKTQEIGDISKILSIKERIVENFNIKVPNKKYQIYVEDITLKITLDNEKASNLGISDEKISQDLLELDKLHELNNEVLSEKIVIKINENVESYPDVFYSNFVIDDNYAIEIIFDEKTKDILFQNENEKNNFKEYIKELFEKYKNLIVKNDIVYNVDRLSYALKKEILRELDYKINYLVGDENNDDFKKQIFNALQIKIHTNKYPNKLTRYLHYVISYLTFFKYIFTGPQNLWLNLHLVFDFYFIYKLLKLGGNLRGNIAFWSTQMFVNRLQFGRFENLPIGQLEVAYAQQNINYRNTFITFLIKYATVNLLDISLEYIENTIFYSIEKIKRGFNYVLNMFTKSIEENTVKNLNNTVVDESNKFFFKK